MAYEDMEENQDEMATAQWRPQRSGHPLVDDDQSAISGNSSLARSLTQMMAQHRLTPNPEGEYYRRAFLPEPKPEPEPSIGQQILALRYPEGSPLRERFGGTASKSFAQRIMEAIRPGMNFSRLGGLEVVRDPKPAETPRPEPLPNYNPAYPPQRELLPYRFGRSPLIDGSQRESLFGGGEPGNAQQPSQWSNSTRDAAPSQQSGSFPETNFSSPNRSLSRFSGSPGYWNGTVDFKAFAAFPDARQQSDATSDRENLVGSGGNQATQQQQPASGPEALGRAAGAAVGAAGGTALGQRNQLPVGKQLPRQGKPPVKGSVGTGGENDPIRVKSVQQLLNEAIEVGQLSGSKLTENGEVTPDMLRLIDTYQRTHKLPKEGLITEGSWTARRLRQNPLEDRRWDGYDETIFREVNSFNKSLKQQYPDFPGLDWRLVKAMLWQESGGPDKGKEWNIWPLQIGRRKADPAILDVISGGFHTDLMGTKDVRKEIAEAYRQHKMTPTLDIRAAVIYLCARAIKGIEAETNAPKLEDQLGAGETLSKFASAHGTTVENLRNLNRGIKGKENALREGTKLIYQQTKPAWSTWEQAIHNYNSETTDPNYVNKVLRYYEAIKNRWSEDSTVRHR